MLLNKTAVQCALANNLVFLDPRLIVDIDKNKVRLNLKVCRFLVQCNRVIESELECKPLIVHCPLCRVFLKCCDCFCHSLFTSKSKFLSKFVYSYISVCMIQFLQIGGHFSSLNTCCVVLTDPLKLSHSRVWISKVTLIFYYIKTFSCYV